MGKGVGVGDLPLGEGYNYDSAIEGSFFGGYAPFFFKNMPPEIFFSWVGIRVTVHGGCEKI